MAAAEDVYLLGICCNLHEASAAIVKNGVLIAAAEEERFSRRKHDNSFPVGAIDYCLREAGVSMSEVSYAGFYWQPWKGLLKRLWWLVRYFPASLQTFQGGKHWRGSAGTLLRHLAVPFKLRRMGFGGTFYFIDHHDAHAASAFLVSPFESAAIITSDLCGENCTTLVGRGDGEGPGRGQHARPLRRDSARERPRRLQAGVFGHAQVDEDGWTVEDHGHLRRTRTGAGDVGVSLGLGLGIAGAQRADGRLRNRIARLYETWARARRF